jgi:hypothetical protein
MTQVSIAIQTHPIRAGMAAALAAQLTAPDLIVDPDPGGIRSPWRTYRRALEQTPPGATNRLVLQDDVTLCRDFDKVVRAAVAARPDWLTVFFVGGLPAEHARAVYRACERDWSWAELDHMRWCPVIATCWPVAYIEPFLGYVDAQNWPDTFRADDEIAGRWLRREKIRPLASVPSLVEHEDVVPSLIGRRARGGTDRSRVAACMIHPDCDPLTIDWEVGP